MANVNDTNNTRGKLESQWRLLREADIDNRDRNAIEDFVRLHRQNVENRALLTLYTDLSTLRNASERADTPLVDMKMGDVRRLLGKLVAPKDQGGYDLDPQGTGIFGYKRALRIFFQWLDQQPDFGDFGFYEHIELPSHNVERVSEDQVPTEEEVEELKAGAVNARDKALIEFLADTAARISLASQLRVGDVYDLDTDRPHYKPNSNGINHKDAPLRRYPILYSQVDLRSYLAQHHIDPRDEAPLWHVLHGYDRMEPEKGALSSDRIRSMLRECKSRADIQKPVNPHNFRHTAITRLSRAGYTPKEIQHIAGWADDRMLEAYDHTTDIERNDQIRIRAGLIDETDTGTAPPRPKTCENCREQLNPSSRFCPRCGTATTEKARTAVEDQEDRFFRSGLEAEGELTEAVREFRRLISEYPTLRAAVLDD
ncbi:site-specific integrase [Natronorarus salvus]|uniref:site-specific integrase n=1 Tax=Natronorarus salvus TaxID=3117733 RepID=UPI002F262756